MELSRTDWGEGIFYNHLATDRFKTGYLSVNFVLPLAEESAAYYALIPKILVRGTRLYPDQQSISRHLEELYGADIISRNYKRGEIQLVSMGIDILNNEYLPADEEMDLLSESIDLLRALLVDPCLEDGHFLAEYIEGEVRNRIHAIRALINNKQRTALEHCQARMFEGEAAAASVEGRIEDYENLDRTKLMSYYHKMLETTRIEIFYVGSTPRARVEELAKTIFATVPRCANAEIPAIEIKRNAPSVRCFEEKIPAAQGVLVMGFRSGVILSDGDHLAMSLMNEVFGGSPASKLFMNVREEQSLCYYCSSFADLLKGTLFVVAGIDPKNKDVTITEIQNQLDAVTRGDITDEELYCAKQSLSNAYRSIADTPDGMESWYLRRLMCGMSDAPGDNAKLVGNLTADDVSAVARKLSLDTVFFLRGEGGDAGGEENECDE